MRLWALLAGVAAASFGLAQTAAHYDVLYSGGTCTIVHNGTSTTNYALLNGQWSGGGNFRGVGRVTCEGTITATFTWDGGSGNEDPPSSVVVQEDSTVSAGGQITSTNNGLGTASPRFTVKSDPGSWFQVTADPYARAENTSGSGQASALAGYRASAHVPHLDLSGPLDPAGSPSILIGQKLTAIVDLDGLPTSPSDWYAWSVSAGSPFNSYTAGLSAAELSAFAPGSAAVASWYFASPVPDGAGIACIVNLPSACFIVARDVRIDEPLFLGNPAQQRHDIGEPQLGRVTLDANGEVTDFIEDPTDAHWMSLWGAFLADVTWGVLWIQQVETPAAYVDSGSRPVGSWSFVQLIEGSAWRRDSDGDYYDASINGAGRCLDTSFPYAGEYSADGEPKLFSDAPGWPLVGYDPPARELYSEESFRTYVFYRPPGEDSVFVPLIDLEWSWSGDAQWVSGSAWWFYEDPCSSIDLVFAYPPHPIWQGYVRGQDVTWTRR